MHSSGWQIPGLYKLLCWCCAMLNHQQFDTITPIIYLTCSFGQMAYGRAMSSDLNHATDDALIEIYVVQGSKKAFETLYMRHYDKTYKRFLKHCKNPDNAADLTQNLWIKVEESLKTYRPDGKFPSYLMRSASNVLTDHWRRKGVRDRVISQANYDDAEDYIEGARDLSADTAHENEMQEQIEYLTTQLIPSLNCEQRLAFLLKHESEYWEYKQRLTWQHLADLNDMDVQQAWEMFEQVRNRVVTSATGQESHEALNCESLLIYMVWTQSQRPFKNQEFTWQYFANVLNVPENTLKTRYRAALKSLAEKLSEHNSHE